jgi:hypothetical protein
MLQPELESVPSNAADVFTQKVLRMSRYDPRGLKNIARTIPGRRLGITDKSYAGLVPTSTRRGNKVCTLHGFAVTFILRERGPRYELVGDCYMHGMMQGEMLEMKPPPRLQGIRIE